MKRPVDPAAFCRQFCAKKDCLRNVEIVRSRTMTPACHYNNRAINGKALTSFLIEILASNYVTRMFLLLLRYTG